MCSPVRNIPPQQGASVTGHVPRLIFSLAGGAQGIGAATVSQLFESGAHVFFGDWDEVKGSKLVEQLRASSSSRNGGSVTSLKVNITDYDSLLALFDTAYEKHGSIDMAICCAAVTEKPGYWEPNKLDLQSVREVCDPLPPIPFTYYPILKLIPSRFASLRNQRASQT